jgi:hypothetical protein
VITRWAKGRFDATAVLELHQKVSWLYRSSGVRHRVLTPSQLAIINEADAVDLIKWISAGMMDIGILMILRQRGYIRSSVIGTIFDAIEASASNAGRTPGGNYEIEDSAEPLDVESPAGGDNSNALSFRRPREDFGDITVSEFNTALEFIAVCPDLYASHSLDEGLELRVYRPSIYFDQGFFVIHQIPRGPVLMALPQVLMSTGDVIQDIEVNEITDEMMELLLAD